MDRKVQLSPPMVSQEVTRLADETVSIPYFEATNLGARSLARHASLGRLAGSSRKLCMMSLAQTFELACPLAGNR